MRFVLADVKTPKYSLDEQTIPSPDQLAGSAVHQGASWVGDKVSDGFQSVLNGIGQGILHGLTTGWHAMPMLLTVVGLGCFLLTIAAGNGKLYGWGCAAWAAAAVVKVMANG